VRSKGITSFERARLQGVPFQSKVADGETQGELQSNTESGSVRIEPFQRQAEIATAGFQLDEVLQGLKAGVLVEALAARLEGVPFQSRISNDGAKVEPL
jgi:hypothetical protein